jgi:hypothetical protein
VQSGPCSDMRKGFGDTHLPHGERTLKHQKMCMTDVDSHLSSAVSVLGHSKAAEPWLTPQNLLIVSIHR